VKETYPISSEKLKYLRRELILTQNEVAKKSGLNALHISEIERAESGVYNVHGTTLKKLATALEVDPKELLASPSAAA
jgi:transcriptional regulator with XRE-family HTH domain